MKNTAKALLAILLSLSLLLSLTLGCVDKDNDNDSPPNGGSSNGGNYNGDGSNEEYIYTAKIISLPHYIENVTSLIYSNDKIYFSFSVFNGQYRIFTTRLFTMNLDGSSLTELFNTNQHNNDDDTFVSSIIRLLCADADGNIWIGERQSLYRYNTPDGFDYDNDKDMDSIFEYSEEISQTTYLKKLDTTGEELISIDLNTLLNTNDISITGAEHDSDGNLIISTNKGVYVFNEEGSLLFNLIHDDITWIQGVITLSDETIAIFDLPGSKTEIQQINIQDKTWGDSFSMHEDAHSVASGNGDNYFFCFNSSNLFGYDKEAEDFHVVLNWVESGLLYWYIQDVTVLDDGRILGVGRIHSLLHSQNFEIFLLTKTLKPETDKTVLTLATFNPSRLITNAVSDFNIKSIKYEIQIIDYLEFATNENWRAGLTKLYLEILSGNAPDIIDVTSLPFKHLANMGLFEDLYSFIDADEVLNRSDFIESVLNVGEFNNKLYRIFPSFSIFTILGDATVLGAEMGWTLDELIAVINANPQADMPLGRSTSNFDLLYWFAMLSLNDFINWETGTTYFDSDAFIRFLEFANSFSDERDQDDDESSYFPFSIMSGRQIMELNFRISDLTNLQLSQTIFDSDLVFKGFPTEDRNGNAFIVDTVLSISSVSKHKEGAWEFIRTMLVDDNRSLFIIDFPTNKALFEMKLDKDLHSLQNHGQASHFNGVTIEYNIPSQEEINNFLTFINSINKMIEYDDVLYKIVSESARDYFNGLRTVEEAARIIQSRASIYVSEQVG
ncbi:MAG: extracellular solute-binding protein [Oscillospiraceae bacterium]|jgi:ABC-type glycerol-3-phosphate transport system substrate-binding protein|nr:extracellular solute-binding protein [Oscillospiraceae bacterium]